MEDIIARKYQALSGALNERQRRLWAAETMSLGYGGLSVVSRATGISRVTINQGIKELKKTVPLSRSVPTARRRTQKGKRASTDLETVA